MLKDHLTGIHFNLIYLNYIQNYKEREIEAFVYIQTDLEELLK